MTKTKNIRLSYTHGLSFLFLFSFLMQAACQQFSMTIPPEFIETQPPTYGTNEWHELNYSMNEFGVKIVNGSLEIKKVDERHTCELIIPNGKLIGINRGEWGGQLTFIPKDSLKASIDIKGGNVKFLFQYNGKTYFIEGLAHLSYSGGALYELNIKDTVFTYEKLIDFEDAPEAFTIYNDKFLIASHCNFYVINNFKKEIVFKDTFWSSLYPNSIAAFNDKNVFVGIRSGIVKLDLTTKNLKFYKYK
jgi:hypothetical protein